MFFYFCLMKQMFVLSFFLLCFISCFAQDEDDIVTAVQTNFKSCQRLKKDSIPCFRFYYNTLDSLLLSVFSKVSIQLPAGEKVALLKDQISWNVKREIYFKKQDENFVYNLKEGTWAKDMIRFVYEDKADFILKRIQSLQKRLKP